MKSFYKIIFTFLFIFSIGIFITYLTVNHTFKEVEKEHLISLSKNSIYNTTIKES